MARSYITDKKVAEIAPLAKLTDAQRAVALTDADRVYAYVRSHEFISETDLRAYGERNKIGPDAMNTALAVLAATGRVVEITGELASTDR